MNFIKESFPFNCKIGKSVTDGPISKMIAFSESPLKTTLDYVKISVGPRRWLCGHCIGENFAKSETNGLWFVWFNLFDCSTWVFYHIYTFIYI